MQHAARVGLLMAVAAALLGWELAHSEATFADGLRYIHRAERFERESWAAGFGQGIDHPLHPMAIAAAHCLIGGDGPASWQRAALSVSFASAVLLVIPTYLLTLELFGAAAAWLACVLAVINPIVGYVVVNVLSESTFFLWWTFGLWASARFFREGRFLWLPLAIGFSGLAYLTRPEGLLLPASIVVALLLLPVVGAARINWPRWWGALAFLVVGFALVAGPYVAIKKGLGTKPAIARVLGLAPRSDPMGLEREHPLPADQTLAKTYELAAGRTVKAFRASVTPPLFFFSLLGVGLSLYQRTRLRAWILLSTILAASAVGLTRLHATGGYLTARHSLIPGMILTLAAAHALTWLMGRAALPGRWFGRPGERLRPGPAVWAALLAALVIYPNVRTLGPPNHGPFSVYTSTGRWIADHVEGSDRVLDMTNWALFFSGQPGYNYAQVYDAPTDPNVRWIVVRDTHVEGHWPYSDVVKGMIGGSEPVAQFPADAHGKQVQIRIYDRRAPLATRTATAAAPGSGDGESTRR